MPAHGKTNGSGTGDYEWRNVALRAPFAPRDGAGALVYKDRMWLIGGWNRRDPVHFPRICSNDVWSSTDGVQWTCHAEAAPWYPRQYHDVAVFDDHMWVLEGYDGGDSGRVMEGFDGRLGGDDGRVVGNRKDVWYSPDGIHWREVPNTPWNRRHAASVFVYDNALWMIAGNNMESDVWKLVRATP